MSAVIQQITEELNMSIYYQSILLTAEELCYTELIIR